MAEKKKYDVKSKGDVIGNVTVAVYANVQEALTALGDEKILGFINRQNKADIMNDYRGNATRSISSTAQLKKMGDKDPARKAQIETLLAKYQKEDDAAASKK